MKGALKKIIYTVLITLLFLAGVGKILRPVSEHWKNKENRKLEDAASNKIELLQETPIHFRLEELLIDWMYVGESDWIVVRADVRDMELCYAINIEKEPSSFSVFKEIDNRNNEGMNGLMFVDDRVASSFGSAEISVSIQIDRSSFNLNNSIEISLSDYWALSDAGVERSVIISNLESLGSMDKFMEMMKKGKMLNVLVTLSSGNIYSSIFSLEGSFHAINIFEECLLDIRPDSAISFKNKMPMADFIKSIESIYLRSN